MTALWITFGIIAFIVFVIYILLHISIRAYIDASNEGVHVKVTYLGIKLWSTDDPKPDGNGEQTPSEPPDEPPFELTELEEVKPPDETEYTDYIDDEPEDDAESVSKLSSIKSTIEKYKPYIPIAKKALRKLIKLIRITDLDVDIIVGDSDAYKAGKKFGNINALFYSILGLICCLFTVKIKHTEIKCDFNSNKVDGRVSTCIKARPSAILCLAIYLGINYLKIKKHTKHKEDKKENETHE